MKKLSLLISLLYGTTVMHGCAWTNPESQKWTVEPFQTIQHATNRPDGYYRLARYYQGQNRFDLAVEAYQKALAIDPKFFEAHNGLGTIYASQGKYEQALAEFNAVAVMAPQAAHIYNNIGYLKFIEGKYAAAISAFTTATSLDPGNQKARNNLNMALAKIDAPTQSNQSIAQATDNLPVNRPHADNDSSHVASAAKADQATLPLPSPTLPVHAPKLNEAGQMASTPPKTRGDIAYPSANKPAGNVVVTANAVKISGDLAPPAKPAQAIVNPPFAVLAKPNPKAMPVVLLSGESVSTEKVTKVEPRTLVKNLSALSKDNAIPARTVKVTTIEKTAPITQLAMVSPRAIGLKASADKLAPKQTVKSASLHGVRKYELEVSNGNGINHLAARFGSMLAAKGLPQANLTNQKPFNQARTVIQYRKGYLFEAARLNRHLRGIQHLAFVVESKDLPPHTDVRLLLGRDLSGKIKLLRPGSNTLASL